jgi:TonB family protein
VPFKIDVPLAFEQLWDSDWHLGAATFQTAGGAARPVFVKTKFPAASGDRRIASICLHLTIGKDGAPRDIQVAQSQDARLDKDAVAIVDSWRFKPGIQNRQPVDVPATLTLVHGQSRPK